MPVSISVVLPVYNCPHYVGEAVESILAQTHTDFELIVIDDGSTDETPRVLEKLRDKRLRLYRQQNRGLPATLNRGIELAEGRYIARQDQDDISLPHRFERQVAHLDAHPHCALVGTWARIWHERSFAGRAHEHPTGNAALKFELLLNNPFVHSSVMMRASALKLVGAYSTDANRQPPEDFELWSRIARLHEVANIPEVLHIYRETSGSMSRSGPSPFLNHMVTICAENIAWAAGIPSSNPNVVNIAALAHMATDRLQGEPDFEAMRDIFRRAAVRVAGGQGDKYAKEAGARIDALRDRYADARHTAAWRRRLARAMRRAKRLVSGT